MAYLQADSLCTGVANQYLFNAPLEPYFDKSWPLPDIEKVKLAAMLASTNT
jgi:hypothetical protein